MSAFSGRSPSFWLLLLCTSLLLDVVLAAEYRVDDVASGITYSGGWQQGAGCTGCFAKPNKDNAYGGTWHDSTRGSGAANYFEYTFTGDAVSVYGIFINIVARNYTFTTNVDLTLSIDGQLVDTFKHQPEDTNSYAYNQLSVSVNGLPARPHTLRVELQPSSNFLFDYLVYNTPDVTGSTSSSSSSRSSSSSTSSSTTQSSTSTSTSTSRRSSFSTLGPVTLADDPVTTPLPTQANSNSDPQTTTTKSSNLGVIIGAVIGGFGALLLLLFLIFFFCFRRKQRQIRQQFEQNHKEAYDSNPVFDGSQSQPLVSMTGFGPNYSSNGMASYHNSGAHGGQMNDMVNPFVPGNGTVVVPPLSTIERLGENGVDYSNLNSKQRMMLDHTQPYTSLQQPTYPPQPLRQSNVPIWVRNLSDDGDMSSHTGALSDDSSPGGLRSFVPSRRQRQSESNHGGARRGPRTISASETSGYLETESDSTSNANSRGAYSGIVGRSSMEKGYATSISSPSNQGHTVPLQHLSQSFHPLQNHPYANPDSYRKPESGISANATNPSAFSHNQTQAYAQLVEQKERRTREEQEAVDELAFIHSAGTNEDSHRLSMGTTAYTYTDGGLVDRRAPSAPPPYIRSPPLPDAPVPSVDVSVLNGGVPPVPPLREKAGWV